LLFAPAGANLALLELMLKRSDHPERWAMGTTVFMMGLFAAAIPLTGGADSPAIPLTIIPAAIAPMRFRGKVVLAFAALTVAVLIVVPVGFDPNGAAHDPRLILASIVLLVSVTVANWALVEAEMTQRDAAVLDPLTGLLNRKALEGRAMELEQQARLTGASVAFVACDLDNFKDVNDTHGHDRGDAVLRSVAYEMRKALRSFELIYRLGGEEFLSSFPVPTSTRAWRSPSDCGAPWRSPSPAASTSPPRSGSAPRPAAKSSTTVCSRPPTRPCTTPRRRGAIAFVAARSPEPAPVAAPALAPAR
jgi:GGDEF domain-containing protein